ncbi:TPA: protein-L-isoaspartate(D-aspartate) O-methyltransferase [Candidatus Poribacteria bacterium]|jgi:protein-L-isoaspartate(D-aspartate) O-methyltransferase|nr:protein-L-isoaspartate(D-aspartate) O-methyltransferase [Candidatus Poribacteria bacterium]HIA67531.1 protein-L-isoaspartate(D-aspartate) O-methyltransferase [Candidatus Poribacteria bacterium]HIB87678.1 protein-L-isoaspartate(D-aspartate) O-methyltransferase [Candidatus Poribacteria bacterium]HIB99283.1 protein-L-isoaspartate(D-aspartate) O-methyltransferase [Candidatus Poribacteria bacterium]HIN28190.1 protein-L-isoaspartate(D-aspartate) O-methyltransferase [Candidatus Poribacteria bacteri
MKLKFFSSYVLLIGVLLFTVIQEFSYGDSEDKYRSERERMVTTQIDFRHVKDGRIGVKNEAVLEAMLRVPRHKFVPRKSQSRAYVDSPLPIGYDQTISQPYIVAYMTEQLKPKKDYKALEIGTGSGYQAAVLSGLVRHVYTIEIIEDLGKRTKKRLKDMKYKNITVKIGDGYFGWKEHSPYDIIIVTAAPNHIPPSLVQQLKPGGVMCIPVGGRFQVQSLILVQKDKDGSVKTKQIMPVRFVPLTRNH